jgi:hypothetical protein
MTFPKFQPYSLYWWNMRNIALFMVFMHFFHVFCYSCLFIDTGNNFCQFPYIKVLILVCSSYLLLKLEPKISIRMSIPDGIFRYYDKTQLEICHTCMPHYGQGQRDGKLNFLPQPQDIMAYKWIYRSY